MEKRREFIAVDAHKGRTIVARLTPGTDLVTGIDLVCKAHNIKYGYFGSVIGSLQKAKFVIAIPDANELLGFKYGDPVEIAGPIEVICGQGVICQSEQGERMIHLHVQCVTSEHRSFGGHFSAGDNPVLATIDLVIVEVDGAKMLRRFDPESGMVMMSPEL